MSAIRILIADDQAIVCEGLSTILRLEEDFELVGVCHNGLEAIDLCRQNRPDIVLMDARMPILGGVEAAKEIMKQCPDAKVLILTTFNDEKLIFESIECGVKGFMLKDMQPDQLCRCIREVQAGGAYLHPDVTLQVMKRLSSGGMEMLPESLANDRLSHLTRREIDVLQLISKGLTNAQIGQLLYITEGTVKNHVSSLLAKMEVRDRTQLAIMAQKGI